MSAFTQGFQHGFFHGMFNRMFGGWNMFACWNQTPVFYTPNLMMGEPFQYQTPMISTPSLWNISAPDFTSSAPSWGMVQNYNYNIPNFSNGLSWGDTFVRTANPATKSKSAKSASSAKSKHWTQMTDTEMRDVYGNYTRDITAPYNGTAEKLNKYLKGRGKLEGKGQAFLDAQSKYGISATVLIAICVQESNGTSKLAQTKNNVGGVRIKGSTEFRTFTSVEECINNIASFLKTGYVNNSTKSLTKLYQVNAKYCPASDTTDKDGTNSSWASGVERNAKAVESVA